MTQNILIIMEDDIRDDRLVRMLDSWGYKTHFLLKTDTNKIPDIHPDLVIMDVQPNDPEAETIVNSLDSPTIYLPLVNKNSDLPNMKTYFDGVVSDENLKFAAEMVVYYTQTSKNLRQNHETYRLLYENAPMAYQSLDETGNIIDVNQTWLKKLGYNKEDVIGSWFGDFLNSANVEQFRYNFPKFKAAGKTFNTEFVMVKADGNEITVSFDGKIGYDSRGNFKQTHCIFKDITAQKVAEDAMRESEKYYKTIFENTGTATIIVEEDSTISLVNTQFEHLYGVKWDKIDGKIKWTDLVTSEHLPKMLNYHKLRRSNPEAVPRNYEFDFVDSSGAIKNIFVTVAIIPETTKSLVSLQDITYMKVTEDTLKTTINEKDTLLREIHHRVKNNLQIISSLLSLQSRYIQDSDTLEVFKESQNRVRSMAIVHEKLYKSDNISKIDFGEYIDDLVNNLLYNYNIEPDKIRFNTNIENIFFDVDTCTPCGLIVNELLTNSVKHAFPGDMNGQISIDLKDNDGTYTLYVRDDGVGFPENVDHTNTDTLGLQLVTNLVNQLEGSIEIINKGGTTIKIKFKAFTM
ncbi:MAG: PAS domain S-box protein [Methanobacterium sp. ERen5]|nr:MAG: PAS domain S-box protein [Methanobacterium sp. ERen5]